MIVVAIIALLAAIAVPGFLRSRKRSQATTILKMLNVIDDAKAQYAAEHMNLPGTTQVTWQDQVGYMKPTTPLYDMYKAGYVLDLLGSPVDDKPFGTPTKVPTATRAALDDVLGGVGSAAADTFWDTHK